MSYQNHSAVNFTELGLSGAQQGSRQHEEAIKPGSEAGGSLATAGRRWFSRRTKKTKKKLIFVVLFVSYVLTNRRRHVSVMCDVCEGQ